MCLFALSLSIPTAQGRVSDSDSKENTTRKRVGQLGQSLQRLVRDPLTGRLIDPEEAKAIEQKPSGQRPSSEAAIGDDIITIETSLFAFEVTVTDPGNQQFVTDLTREDFQLFEDGEEQEITYFINSDQEKVPTSIAFILDHSGSITPYWDESRRAAINFVRRLKPQFQEVALVLDDPTLVQDFTRDVWALEKSLNKVKLTKNTYNFTSLFAVMKELMADRPGRKIIIFQTDGDEALRLVPENDWPEDVKVRFRSPKRAYTLQDIFDYASSSGITVYSVAVGPQLIRLKSQEEFEARRPYLESLGHDGAFLTYFRHCQQKLAELAELTGGSISYMEKASDAEAIYRRIGEDIRARYIIGYYPGSEKNDGRFHTLDVKVKGHPDWIVMGRRGYYAKRPASDVLRPASAPQK